MRWLNQDGSPVFGRRSECALIFFLNYVVLLSLFTHIMSALITYEKIIWTLDTARGVASGGQKVAGCIGRLATGLAFKYCADHRNEGDLPKVTSLFLPSYKNPLPKTLFIIYDPPLNVISRVPHIKLNSFRTLYPTWQLEILRARRWTMATWITPRGDGSRSTVGNALGSTTDWEKGLTVLLSRVSCSPMSNPWRIRWTILEPG